MCKLFVENFCLLNKIQLPQVCTYSVNPYRIKFFERGAGKTFFQKSFPRETPFYKHMPELFQKSTFFSEPPEIRIHEAEHDGRLMSHTHEFYEIVYVADGFTLHSSAGRVNMLVTGDLFFVRPGEEHSYINAYRTKLYNLIFTADELGSELTELSKLPGLDVFSKFL